MTLSTEVWIVKPAVSGIGDTLNQAVLPVNPIVVFGNVLQEVVVVRTASLPSGDPNNLKRIGTSISHFNFTSTVCVAGAADAECEMPTGIKARNAIKQSQVRFINTIPFAVQFGR